jgi:hypothetical protein
MRAANLTALAWTFAPENVPGQIKMMVSFIQSAWV